MEDEGEEDYDDVDAADQDYLDYEDLLNQEDELNL